jgi:lipopolysaccharide export LptBFGC system permease protein LptF
MWTVLLALFVAAIIALVSVYTSPTSSPKRETIMAQMNTEPASSYAQKTNHYQMTPVDMGPIAGFETPFRVNMFQAYMT